MKKHPIPPMVTIDASRTGYAEGRRAQRAADVAALRALAEKWAEYPRSASDYLCAADALEALPL